MKLTELPSILVERVDETAVGTTIRGRFDRLDGVRETGSFRLKRGGYAWSDLSVEDRPSCSVVAVVTYVGDLKMSVGERYTWLDRYWQLPFVEALADESTQWNRFTFEPSHAQYFKQGDCIGLVKAGEGTPDGAARLKLKPSGWDHEHCDLCTGHIDAKNPIGYAKAQGHFLCSPCYEKYGASCDVSFLLSA